MKTQWDKQTEFYIIVIDKYVKIGITHDWERRLKRYLNDSNDAPLQKIKSRLFPNRWQAELIEQVIKYRLYPTSVSFHREYTERPIKDVLDCYFSTIKELEGDSERFRFIHQYQSLRWPFYQRIAAGQSIEGFEPSELPIEIRLAWMRLRHTDKFKFK